MTGCSSFSLYSVIKIAVREGFFLEEEEKEGKFDEKSFRGWRKKGKTEESTMSLMHPKQFCIPTRILKISHDNIYIDI